MRATQSSRAFESIVLAGRSGLATSILCAVLALAAGSTSAATVSARPAAANAAAIAAARSFLTAFERGDFSGKVALMSAALRQRNRHESVARMLGVQNLPQGFDILAAADVATATGRSTHVVVALRYASDTVVDVLTVVSTPAGYRIDTIAASETSATMRAVFGPATQFMTVLDYWNAFGRHKVATAYLLMSPALRRTLISLGITEAHLAASNDGIGTLEIAGIEDVTPRYDGLGRKEYRVRLTVTPHHTVKWVNGLNVRYVLVVPGTITPWAIERVAYSAFTY